MKKNKRIMIITVIMVVVGFLSYRLIKKYYLYEKIDYNEYIIASNRFEEFVSFFYESSVVEEGIIESNKAGIRLPQNAAIPFVEDVESILNESDFVNEWLPYYEFNNFDTARDKEELEAIIVAFETIIDKKETLFEIPLIIEGTDGGAMFDIRIIPYYSEIGVNQWDNVGYTLNNKDNGVYIGSYLAKQLGINRFTSSATIKFDIYIPVAIKMGMSEELISQSLNKTIESHEIIETAQTVKMTIELEIKGILSDNGNFGYGNDIYIPYEMGFSWQLDALKNVVLNEGESLWVPQCYIIKTNQEVTALELGKSLQNKLSDFIIGIQDYGLEFWQTQYHFE